MTDAELYSAAESIYDGWYADTRIDWEDFLDRLESYAGVDLVLLLAHGAHGAGDAAKRVDRDG